MATPPPQAFEHWPHSLHADASQPIGPVRNAVGANVGRIVGVGVGRRVGATVGTSVGGAHHAVLHGWLSMIDPHRRADDDECEATTSLERDRVPTSHSAVHMPQPDHAAVTQSSGGSLSHGCRLHSLSSSEEAQLWLSPKAVADLLTFFRRTERPPPHASVHSPHSPHDPKTHGCGGAGATVGANVGESVGGLDFLLRFLLRMW